MRLCPRVLSPQVSARAAVSDAGRIRRRLTPQCRAWCGGEPAGAPRPCCARAGWAQPPGRSPRRKQEQQRPEGAAWTGVHAAQRAMLTIEGVGERLSLATGQGYRGRGSTFMIAAKANLVEKMVQGAGEKGERERENGVGKRAGCVAERRGRRRERATPLGTAHDDTTRHAAASSAEQQRNINNNSPHQSATRV